MRGQGTAHITNEDRRAGAATRIGISLAKYDAQIAAGKKWCWQCKRWRNRATFGTNRHNLDGLQTMCGDCRRVYQRTRSARIRMEERARLVDYRRTATRQATEVQR